MKASIKTFAYATVALMLLLACNITDDSESSGTAEWEKEDILSVRCVRN